MGIGVHRGSSVMIPTEVLDMGSLSFRAYHTSYGQHRPSVLLLCETPLQGWPFASSLQACCCCPSGTPMQPGWGEVAFLKERVVWALGPSVFVSLLSSSRLCDSRKLVDALLGHHCPSHSGKGRTLDIRVYTFNLGELSLLALRWTRHGVWKRMKRC